MCTKGVSKRKFDTISLSSVVKIEQSAFRLCPKATAPKIAEFSKKVILVCTKRILNSTLIIQITLTLIIV